MKKDVFVSLFVLLILFMSAEAIIIKKDKNFSAIASVSGKTASAYNWDTSDEDETDEDNYDRYSSDSDENNAEDCDDDYEDDYGYDNGYDNGYDYEYDGDERQNIYTKPNFTEHDEAYNSVITPFDNYAIVTQSNNIDPKLLLVGDKIISLNNQNFEGLSGQSIYEKLQNIGKGENYDLTVQRGDKTIIMHLQSL